ncbi:MAG: serine/threonine protein kinase [Deltaproteobacteria bacterium]|nr:serine/threonine protein kinase [Deltaproteobacteria bacterium]
MARKPEVFETAFESYTRGDLLGEGGSGQVFAAVDSAQNQVAIKIMGKESTSKRRRFKNETSFLSAIKHPNIVPVFDRGIHAGQPFYVMPRYGGSLRTLMESVLPAEKLLSMWRQILDGVEAAHLLGAIHRDLKPENVLVDASGAMLVADFGIASFVQERMETNVETGPGERLANFEYAAPEQRRKGAQVGVGADIYALGLILNELFTGAVPQGTAFARISERAPSLEYLDAIVDRCLRQAPSDRYSSIQELKSDLQAKQGQMVATQRLSKITNQVVEASTIDDPLALSSPSLIAFDWADGILSLTLSRPISNEWVAALRRADSVTSVLGKGPDRFRFSGTVASVSAEEHEVQQVINYFKEWLIVGTNRYRYEYEQAARRREADEREDLQRQRASAEARLRVLKTVKI